MTEGSSRATVKTKYYQRRIGRIWRNIEISVTLSEIFEEVPHYIGGQVAKDDLVAQYSASNDPVDF